MKVKIKKLHPDAVIPSYAKEGDAGMDLTATEKYYDNSGNQVYKVGLAFEIPEGYVGLLFARSSLSKRALSLTNSVGVIDSGYRGEVCFKFKPTLLGHSAGNYVPDPYAIGDRVGQIIIMPYPARS